MGVVPLWYQDLVVDEAALIEVFDEMRQDAGNNGCSHFPGRVEIATNDMLLDEFQKRYEAKTGQSIPPSHLSHFRRWILHLYKSGGTPN